MTRKSTKHTYEDRMGHTRKAKAKKPDAADRIANMFFPRGSYPNTCDALSRRIRALVKREVALETKRIRGYVMERLIRLPAGTQRATCENIITDIDDGSRP